MVSHYLNEFGFIYPNNLIKMAMIGYFSSVFTLDDLTQIYGSYVAKDSIHIEVRTLGYLQDKILYQSFSGSQDYINKNGKVIDRLSLLPSDLRNNEQFFDKFSMCLTTNDDDIEDQLKLYFTVKWFIDLLILMIKYHLGSKILII